MNRNRILLVVMLAVVGSALAGLLLLDHHGIGPAKDAVQQICGAGEDSGCEQVARSRFSTLEGFSLAGIGLFFYSSVLLLCALGLVSSDRVRDSSGAALFLLFGAAFFLDMVLLGVQAFAIGAYCKLCVGTYVVNLLALLALLPAARLLSTLSESFPRGEGRSLLGVWAMGSLFLFFGVASLDRALASAGAENPAPLLGEASRTTPSDPAPSSSTTTTTVEATTVEATSPPSGDAPEKTATPPAADAGKVQKLEEELRQAQARIQSLQAIVDDPQKYGEYQAEKAARDFEGQKAQKLALDGVPFKGPAEAPIKVTEFSDFLCPFCRNLAGAFAGYMHETEGKNRVAIYFKNYPLDQSCNTALPRTVHVGACEVALGGICANQQGKFWEYHDRIFSQPPDSPDREAVIGIGTSIGLNGDQLRKCMGSAAAHDKLERDIREGQSLEVKATPTVFVNGKRLEQINAFLKAIESEEKRLGLPSTP